MIILDTDVITLVQRTESEEGLRVRARVAQLPPGEGPAATIITYEEQVRGWMAKIKQAEETDRMIEVYSRLVKHIDDYRRMLMLPFDLEAFSRYQLLRKQHRRLGTMDLKIAAIVLTRNGTLISRNLQDFSKIHDLRVEDWTKP